MSDSQMEFFKLIWKLEHKNSGIDDSPNNPLNRALKTLLDEGRPIESFSICLYGGEEAELNTQQFIRWLGVLILSVGGRVIFFPGLSINPSWVQTTIGRHIAPKQNFMLDHASLDIKKQSWHVTTPGSKKHYTVGRTPDIGEGRLLWLGMSVANEKYLRELKQETSIDFQCHPNDSQRRIEVFKQTQRDAAYRFTMLANGARSRFDEGFLHFRFVVSPKGAPLYKGDNWLLPTGAPYLETPFPAVLDQLPIRFHETPLSDIYSIQITTCWLPGSLSVPIVFTTPKRI